MSSCYAPKGTPATYHVALQQIPRTCRTTCQVVTPRKARQQRTTLRYNKFLELVEQRVKLLRPEGDAGNVPRCATIKPSNLFCVGAHLGCNGPARFYLLSPRRPFGKRTHGRHSVQPTTPLQQIRRSLEVRTLPTPPNHRH